ncbi:MAG TPA: outer membrane lipoprotein carrier protein LolA, partial [Smithellaceae bacterium]|nr:outer membrane lipoprotein carrier protein LolA [Smithellaceae bacterium]
MIKKIGLLLLILILLAPAGVRADEFGELRKESARIKTISADFVQKKTMKILSKPLVSEGKFFYAAPDSIRWEYAKPVRSVVISGKGATKRYMAAGGKMVEDSTGGAQSMKIVLDEVAGWMGGRFDANPSFKASLKDGNPVVITLVPVEKGMKGFFEKIEIAVSKKDASVKSVRIVESASAETRID